jgi:hypothetical protein
MGERSDSRSGSFTVSIHRTGEKLGPSADLKAVRKSPPKLAVLYTEFWCGNLEGKNHLEELDVDW